MAAAQAAPDPALGVFDTLLARRGEAVALRAHVERVTRSVRELYAVPTDRDRLARRIAREAAAVGTGRVRTTYRPSGGGWTVEAEETQEPGLEPRRLVVRRVAGGLGAHKWVDRRLVADAGAADDVLVVDEAGQVLECGWANVFAVVGDTLATPPLDGRILPGTVRARVLAVAASAGLRVVERPLLPSDLAAADEVLATSSIRGVQPVVSCEEVGRWDVGPHVARLRELVAAASWRGLPPP